MLLAFVVIAAWIASLLFIYKMGRLRGETDAMNESTAFLQTLSR
jgi:hypothetical protein